MSWKTNTKNVMVSKVGTGEVKQIEVTQEDTAQTILTAVGASSSMVLTSDPQRAKVFDKDEVLWDFLEDGMELYSAPPTPVGC
jgi:hypothetical protein